MQMQMRLGPQVAPGARSTGQSAQMSPFLPQLMAVFPGSQVLPLQQPVPHDVASQVHAPLTQCCPEGQASAPPQVQTPAVQVSAVMGQVKHACPAMPQSAAVVRVTQLLALQQPAQLVASQTQPTPVTQCWPVPQAGPPAQVQAPAVQPSASSGLHDTQACPPAPQAAGSAPPSQTDPLQQPLGHDWALHPQLPALQLSPEGHAPPVPQPHTLLLQESVPPPTQLAQAAPPWPQAVGAVPAWQAPFKQHPRGQTVALQPVQAPF